MDVVVSMPDPVARQWGAIRPRRSAVMSSEDWQAEAFLKERGVPLNYSAADLDADAATLEKILPLVSVVVSDTSPLHYLSALERHKARSSPKP